MGSVSIQDLLNRVQGVHIGVDIGQKQDYTAVVVAEVSERDSERVYRGLDHKIHVAPESVYRVQELRRLPLGTPFVSVAKEIVSLVGAVHEMERVMRKDGRLTPYEYSLSCDVFMDATGLGSPIVELVTDALRVSGKTDRARVHPVVFTYGDRFVRGGYEGAGDSLGKAYLVNRLQILLEQDRLDLPKDDEAISDMVEELKNYEIRIDPDANEKYGAFAVGTHDDMVTALGLACIEEPGYYRMTRVPRFY